MWSVPDPSPIVVCPRSIARSIDCPTLETLRQIFGGVEHEGVALLEFYQQAKRFQTQQIGAGGLVYNVMNRLMLADPIDFAGMPQRMPQQSELPVIQLGA